MDVALGKTGHSGRSPVAEATQWEAHANSPAGWPRHGGPFAARHHASGLRVWLVWPLPVLPSLCGWADEVVTPDVDFPSWKPQARQIPWRSWHGLARQMLDMHSRALILLATLTALLFSFPVLADCLVQPTQTALSANGKVKATLSVNGVLKIWKLDAKGKKFVPVRRQARAARPPAFTLFVPNSGDRVVLFDVWDGVGVYRANGKEIHYHAAASLLTPPRSAARGQMGLPPRRRPFRRPGPGVGRCRPRQDSQRPDGRPPAPRRRDRQSL